MAQQSAAMTEHTGRCQICKKSKKLNTVAPAELIYPPIVEVIVKEHPDWSAVLIRTLE